MNLKEIKEIVNMMQENGLAEIELEKQGLKLKLKKHNGNIVVQEQSPVSAPIQSAPVQAIQSSGEASSPAQPTAAANETLVRSPMVGTFYLTPSPDQPPYVNVGSSIKNDDVLCIIEAMKLMNEIKSDISGKIVEVLVESGAPVEFDQPLFRVQTS